MRFLFSSFFGLIVTAGMCACSMSQSTSSSNTSTSIATGTSTGTSTNTSTGTSTEVDTLSDRPLYASGSCSGTVGCINGFISHGTQLTFTPESSSTTKDARGGNIVVTTYKFKDAQDFGDRFNSAFLKPLVPEDKIDQYEFKIAPTVKRDNFAAGFELFSEGETANDERVRMESEGNFSIGDITPFDKVLLRAVKTFRIEITKKSDASADTPEVTRAVTCLEIDATLENLSVEAGKPHKVGGLRNFRFYFTESDALCSEDKVGESQSREVDARSLPPVGPELP